MEKETQKRILVIDDEQPIAKALELKLAHEGFMAHAVFNGEEGIAELESNQYDLVLCDLVMPKVDGFEFLEALKEKGIDTPVIVLTNLSQEGDSEKAKELGARDVFVKSNIPISEIVSYVQKYFTQ